MQYVKFPVRGDAVTPLNGVTFINHSASALREALGRCYCDKDGLDENIRCCARTTCTLCARTTLRSPGTWTAGACHVGPEVYDVRLQQNAAAAGAIDVDQANERCSRMGAFTTSRASPSART